MATTAGLGYLNRLPYHVRELIWSELSDVRGVLPEPCTLTPYLGLLRASRNLYDDITGFLFKGCVLQIMMGPRHATALFSREYSLRRPHLNQFPFLRTSMQSLFYLNAYSFGPFPFHIIDLVETKLEAPNPSKMEDIYYLWRNVCETVDLLKGAQLLRHMVLFLQSEFFEKPTADKPSLGDFDYKFFLRPFGQLRQVATVIEVEIFLCSMENPLDWELINWILGTKYGSEACEETTSIETASEQQLQRALARDWYNVCLNAGTPGRGWGISPSTLHPVHAAILAAWTSKKPSGKSEFAEKIGYILTNYPEIIEELDPSLSLFTKIRHALTNRRWEALGHVMDCPAACSDFVELDQLAQMIGELMVKYWNNHQGPTQANTGEVILDSHQHFVKRLTS